MAGSAINPSGLTALFESKEAVGAIKHLGVMHDSPTKKLFEKKTDTSVAGYTSKKFKLTLKELYAHGYRANGENRPIDRPATSSATTTKKLDFDVIKPELFPARNFMRLTFNDEELDMKNGSTSAALAINQKIERAMEGKSRDDCRVVHGDGSGIIGHVLLTTTSDGTATTSTVDLMRDDQTNNYYAGKPGARWLYPGRPFVFFRSGAKVASSYAHIVDSVNPARSATTSAGSLTNVVDRITLDAALNANLADGDVVVSGDFNGNAYNDEPLGLNAWFDDGRRVPVVCGVNRLTNKRFGTLTENIYTTSTAQGSAGYFQALTEVLFFKVIGAAATTTGAKSFACVMNPEVFQNFVYEAELYGGSAATTPFRARLNQSKGIGTGQFFQGMEDFTFAHPQLPGGVTWVNDFYADFSQIVGFDPATVTCFEWQGWKLNPGWGAAGMTGAYHYDADTGDVEVTYSERKNYYCEAPHKSFRIERIFNYAAGQARTID